MGVKKLRSIFMKYILIVAVGILCIIFLNAGLYMLAAKTNVIYPAVEVEKLVSAVKEDLQTSSKFSPDELPSFIEYARFDLSGKLQQSSLDAAEAELIWNNCIVNKKESDTPYRFLLVERENDIIILRYRFTAQFSNSVFRR